MEKFTCLPTSKYVKGYTDSKIAKYEKNDCVVRAIAASFNVSYNRAHKLVKEEFKRKDKNGTFFTTSTMLKLSTKGKVFNKRVTMIGEDRNNSDRKYLYTVRGNKKYKMTLLTFTREYNKGKYFVLVRKHALAVIDGVLVGNYDESYHMRRIVEAAFKIGVR